MLLIPVLTPFFLLGMVIGLSWLEDRLLPPPVVARAQGRPARSSHAEPAAPRPDDEARRAA